MFLADALPTIRITAFSSPPHSKPSRCRTMTADAVPSAASPPTSPPAKRIKTDIVPIMATESNGVPKVDQAALPLLIKKLSDKARLPTRGSAFAAGYDLYAARDTVVPARGRVLVDTDISMAVPAGTCKSPRSFPTTLPWSR